MDSEHILNNQAAQDGKRWEIPWTTDEIRKNRGNWTLAGDVGLFHLLNQFSHNIISRTHEMENAVDTLVHKTKIASAKINNVMNDFHMLSNLQFVENRVYDEELQDTAPEEKITQEKTKEQREAEMLPRIIKAVELGLSVLDQAFDKINVDEISDSEDEEDLSSEGRTILEPKDPYENRPLPFIIGSEEFQNDDFAGLRDLCEEEVVEVSAEDQSVSESEESSSEEEESLPLDDTKFIGIRNEKVPAESISDKLSSSDESELFGSEKEENGFLSDSSFDSKKKEAKEIQKPDNESIEKRSTRQSSVSSMQSRLNLPQVLPVHKKEEKPKDERDLFSNEDELSDDESPFRKKSGLFASEVTFDEDEKDMFSDDLFGEKPKEKPITSKPENIVKPKITKVLPTSPAVTKDSILFDDENSEDDMFSTLTKAKVPQLAKPAKKESKEASKKAKSSLTPSASVLSTKGPVKSVGFDDGKSSLFGDDSDAEDLFSGTKSQKKFDFEATEDDDLFGLLDDKVQKAPEKKEKVQSSKPREEKKSISLFEESGDSGFNQSEKTEIKKPYSAPVSKKMSPSLFDDSDNSEQETKDELKHTLPLAMEKKKEDLSLFDEEDIFQKKTSKVNKRPLAEKKDDLSLFDDGLLQQSSKESSQPVKLQKDEDFLSLFDSDDQLDKGEKSLKTVTKAQNQSLFKSSDPPKKVQQSPSSLPVKEQISKPTSLFEDSDNFDLFSSKVPSKEAETVAPKKTPLQKEKESLPSLNPQISDQLDGSVTSKTKETKTGTNVVKTEDQSMFKGNDAVKETRNLQTTTTTSEAEIGFDVPVDSKNTLNVIGKDRVKVAAKRRKPTRKGRLAALQSVESDEKSVDPSTSNTVVTNSELSLDGNLSVSASNSSTSGEKLKTSYKDQEKKKMNLMSQLISEVATSDIRKKKSAPKDDSDDEVDIFSATTKKVNSQKSDFSFLSPTESSLESKLSSDVSENTQDGESEVANILSSETADNDDFFAEPSFEGFRASISHKESVLDLDDDDEDDDLFKAIKNSPVPKLKSPADSNDIFTDETDDIFSGLQKEKYEMFPSQLYDDEDDIFGSSEKPSAKKAASEMPSKLNSTSKKEPEKKQVNVFDDPLTGLLGDD